ncbi:hypothetical protein F6R98_11260 [Candidatus Methylospira mobilis]|uniref:Uncharacterized protein n=1 Tax=Candidatus Methylospira mobilis TaxID=1808979 RepID=A0A5Q0BN03_9GAMM|nr:hypothetical protein [Candidatus Methylospira mobilis]QFY43126.1 hypothetical protein F6R98_11260 [Candidatus Methylospira mobilis]
MRDIELIIIQESKRLEDNVSRAAHNIFGEYLPEKIKNEMFAVTGLDSDGSGTFNGTHIFNDYIKDSGHLACGYAVLYLEAALITMRQHDYTYAMGKLIDAGVMLGLCGNYQYFLRGYQYFNASRSRDRHPAKPIVKKRVCRISGAIIATRE